MAKKKGNPFTDVSFLLFSALAIIVGALCYAKGQEFFLQGLDASWLILLEVLPRVIGAFLMAGYIQVLVPKDVINRWVGEKSGIRGVVVATLGGVLTPGGPMISFPLIAALYKLGADSGPLVAYLTSWELLGIQRIIVWEIPFMGLRFALLRFGVSMILPIIAGLTAKKLMAYLGGSFKMEKEE